MSQVVRCERCGHVWDDDDPNDEVCDCIDKRGRAVTEVFESSGPLGVTVTESYAARHRGFGSNVKPPRAP